MGSSRAYLFFWKREEEGRNPALIRAPVFGSLRKRRRRRRKKFELVLIRIGTRINVPFLPQSLPFKIDAKRAWAQGSRVWKSFFYCSSLYFSSLPLPRFILLPIKQPRHWRVEKPFLPSSISSKMPNKPQIEDMVRSVHYNIRCQIRNGDILVFSKASMHGRLKESTVCLSKG